MKIIDSDIEVVTPEQMPGVATAMTFERYLADPVRTPSVTSSIVRSLLATAPRRVWQETKRLNPHAVEARKLKFDIGTAAHAMFICEGNPIVVLPYDNYLTKVAKAARDEAYARGVTPLLQKDYAKVRRMADEAVSQFMENPFMRAVLEGGDQTHPEASIFWQDPATRAFCRCRPDIFWHAPNETPVVVHYKTTETMLNPFTIGKFAASCGWDLTAAHYEAGVKALTGADVVQQLFAVQEVAPPHLCMVVGLDEGFMMAARRRHHRALTIWQRCVTTGNWPMHVLLSTVLATSPPWHEAENIRREDHETDYEIDNKRDVYEAMGKWYAAGAPDGKDMRKAQRTEHDDSR